MTTMTLNNKELIKKDIRQRTARPLLWIGMGSIVMFFGGLTSAVIVSSGGGGWQGFEFPFPFWVSTVVILLSSATFQWAISLTKKDRLPQMKTPMVITLALGILFMISQLMGWRVLVDQGIYFTGSDYSAAASFFYVLTWAHFAHAIGGIISLIVVTAKSFKNSYNSKNLLGLQLSVTYWHFLGGLWIYLLIFLSYINQNI
jgi:cytochrome c oxidase subunit 3